MNDINEDKLEFRPITQGLGFHQKQRKAKILSKETTSPSHQDQKHPLSTRASHVQGFIEEAPSPYETIGHATVPSFKKRYQQVQEEKVKDRPLGQPASWPERLCAYILDFLPVMILTVIELLFLSQSYRLFEFESMSSENALTVLFDLWPYAIAMFLVQYILYFMVFDRPGLDSPGKVIVGLRLRFENQEDELGFLYKISRALLVLLSPFTLFLVSRKDLLKRLTNTWIEKIPVENR